MEVFEGGGGRNGRVRTFFIFAGKEGAKRRIQVYKKFWRVRSIGSVRYTTVASVSDPIVDVTFVFRDLRLTPPVMVWRVR